MNDADIIKRYADGLFSQSRNACRAKLMEDSLDLINRQKAEIERLQGYNENLLTANTALSNEILDIKTEAIKEFYEKIEEIITEIYNKHIFGYYDLEDEEKEAVMDFCNDIEFRISDFMEEMTEENNA